MVAEMVAKNAREKFVSREPVKLSPWLMHSRRLRLNKRVYWQHHRGGWRHVVELIGEQLHVEDGTRFLSAVEDELFVKGPYFSGPITEPWVGFIHQMPHQHLGFPDLERLMKMDSWRASIEHCQGLWVLSDYQRRFLLENDPLLKVARVYYPTTPATISFSLEKFLAAPKRKLVFIGEFLRNFQRFYDLKLPSEYEKIILRSPDIDVHFRKLNVVENDSVTSRYEVDNAEYDQLLGESIVFLNLFDAGGVTTVVECIASGTPILINPVGGVVEYLGDDYPYYYETLEEAASKACDLDLLEETARYLQNHPLKDQLTDSHFLQSIQNTTVYRELPLPRSQQSQFRAFDVSLIICSYKRVHNLKELLSRLADQDFNGTYEVLIWNNNIETVDEVAEICRPFTERLSLKLMHSTENFYCQIRTAMASLIRSDLILICDDDVFPQRNYISAFVEKYREYGPEAVICARGHVFLPHKVDEDRPERFWTDYEGMQFYDEHQADRKIHFLHADNCLIPKSIMKQALQYEMPSYEISLIDDYWLSYVLCAHLDVPIWKAKMDDCLLMTDSADDPDIALFHNPLVNEQRVNFYIYHMRHGWPGSASGNGSGPKKVSAPATISTLAETTDYQKLARELISHEKIISGAVTRGFSLRFMSAVVRQQDFFVNESARERELLMAEWDELVAVYQSLKLKDQALLDYANHAIQELRAADIPETIVRSGWSNEELSEHTLSVPTTIALETKRYFKWLAARLQGIGEIVELGSWLGSGTMSLAEGMACNPAVAKQRIHVFDLFKWGAWMFRFISPHALTKFPALSLMKRGDDFLDLYLELCSPYKRLIEARRCYVRTDDEVGNNVGPLVWGRSPIELFVYDLGYDYYLIENAWEVFSPSFIPGKTIVAVNCYGNEEAREVRRFLEAHADQLRPIHKPASTAKAFLYTGGE